MLLKRVGYKCKRLTIWFLQEGGGGDNFGPGYFFFMRRSLFFLSRSAYKNIYYTSVNGDWEIDMRIIF